MDKSKKDNYKELYVQESPSPFILKKILSFFTVSTTEEVVEVKNPIATLKNIGNSCFINSVIFALRCFDDQILHNLHHSTKEVKKLVNYHLKEGILNSIEEFDKENTVKAMTALHELYCKLNEQERIRMNTAINTREFRKSSKFQRSGQQDAHEFLLTVLNDLLNLSNIIEELATLKAANLITHPRQVSRLKRFFKSIFTFSSTTPSRNDHSYKEEGSFKCGLLKNYYNFNFRLFNTTKICCLICGKTTSFSEMSLNIELCVTKDEILADANQLFRTKCVTTEYLTGQNKYSCDTCHKLTNATREISYKNLPNLLIFQLKRFSLFKKSTFYFPTPLELHCFCDECLNKRTKHLYELKAIIFHVGENMHCGHYLSLCKFNKKSNDCFKYCCSVHVEENSWIECNDESAKVLKESAVIKSLEYSQKNADKTPYILFYSLKN